MPKILVAEDNRLNQVVAAGALRKLGFEFDLVDDGASAVTACLLRSYDAILMDVMMARMDGYEATEQILANEEQLGLIHVPVIGLSARALPGDREIALAAGMDDYLTKPLHLGSLRSALDRWISVVLIERSQVGLGAR